MELRFAGELWYWRGPAPFHFVTVPPDASAALAEVAPMVSYGWGMVPVTVRVGDTVVTTSLWPKDGGYIVPVKRVLQDAERLGLGDVVAMTLTVEVRLR